MKPLHFASLICLTLLLSCTVQKRKHLDGFYVSWKHKKAEQKTDRSIPAAKKQNNSTETVCSTNTNEMLTASVSDDLSKSDVITPKAVISFTDVECDVIVMRNGEEVQAKVSEVSSTLIKYKRCDLVDGPLYTVNKSDVFMIKYPNGTKEVFSEQNTAKNSYSQGKPPAASKSQRKLLPLALAGFVASLVALIMPVELVILALLLLAAAVIMGVAAISKINARPTELKGKGFAIVGLIIGVVFGLLILLALASA